MAQKSKEKRELILAKAEQVFIRCGFNSVTMKDIIEESEISRGGIYLYFSSVDEIFMEVVRRHNGAKLESAKNDSQEDLTFRKNIDKYFDTQKERLLHMEDSLLPAMFEFFMAHKNDSDKNFFTNTFVSLENTIIEILKRGAEAGYLHGASSTVLAKNILYCIKGLETLAMANGVSEELLDAQFDFCKQIIFSLKEDDSHEN